MYMEINFPKLEKKIFRFWKENAIFEKSIERRKRAKKFVFFEGPPTANAKPGIHHVLSRVFKDIICRYKTMRGFRVVRKAGWDTHGLPVELEIEKKLSLKSKKDIEKYGIARFNRKCKESVWEYKKDWEKLTERIGYWLDLENPYITYETNYIESVWWILKEIWKKGLLYQDFKVVPYCPRCGTSLSSHEVAQGYEKIKEPAIYIKLRIKNPEFKNTSLLVWTTTPWTLPGNVAIAVNPNFTYVRIKVDEEYLILAKERLEPLKIKGEIFQEFKGKDLIDLRYEGLYPPDYDHVSRNIYKVLPADFVSLEEGTGLVHIAPAFGEEDMELIKTLNVKCRMSNEPEFPILLTVDEEGKFKFEVKKWASLFVKDADPKIIEDLKNRGLLFKEELYEHDYPFCWRCHTPLLYYAKESWFIKMTKVKKDLIKNNQRINWIPNYLKEGRFGEWLREIKDWALSRERYWGTPLPIWQCENCGNLEIIDSLKDLLSQEFSTNNYFIFRHGESLLQTKYKNLMWGWNDTLKQCGLTKKGRAQIKKITKALKNKRIDLIYSSDLLRTAETARIISEEIGVKIIFDKRLRDIYWGEYIGKKKEEFFRDFPHTLNKFKKGPRKGESWNKCKLRIINFLKDIDNKYSGKNILIVGHGDPLWLLEGALKGLTNEELLRQKIQKKAIKVGEIRKIKFNSLPLNEQGELDFHRPYIDEVKFYCQKCGDLMERTPEVIDCWFDAGSVPFAQYHYPFENRNLINKKIQFPANYISEAIDQTRGWFYTLLAISTLLGLGTSYKNVISLGHVLDEKGEKMSKSKGNVVDPWLILEKYSVDATRWYFYTVNQPGDSKLFSEKDVKEALKKFILTLWNCFLFYQTYVLNFKRPPKTWNIRNDLDRWIVSKLNGLIQEVTQKLDEYDITFSARAIKDFVVNDLSLWYVRRSRERFHLVAEKELKEASQTLGFVLLTLNKLAAPFIPFLSEEIYQKIFNFQFSISNSVHLEDWPKANKKLIDKKLNKKMETVREIVTQVLSERTKAKIKVRQPLNEIRIANYELKKDEELLDLIKKEVNVKKITFGKSLKLDTKITPELKEEGILREIIRNLQEMRKMAGYTPKDMISIQFDGSGKISDILIKNKNKIIVETKSRDLKLGRKEKFKIEKEVKVDNEKLWLTIKKI